MKLQLVYLMDVTEYSEELYRCKYLDMRKEN